MFRPKNPFEIDFEMDGEDEIYDFSDEEKH
jgi:hypothetical protein